jgi:hypothetical protein
MTFEVDPAAAGPRCSFIFNRPGFGGYDACNPDYAASAGGPAQADDSARGCRLAAHSAC